MNPFDGLGLNEDKLRALAECDWSTVDPELIRQTLLESADELELLHDRVLAITPHQPV